MSSAEDRLTDALDAVGRTVRDEDLRPLHDLPAGSSLRVRPGWRRRLAPAAAVVAVVVIAGLSLIPILGHGTGRAAGGRGGASTGVAPHALIGGVSQCTPRVVASASGGPAAAQVGDAREVASGTVVGHSWSVWVEKGMSEPAALENGGIVLSGRWYGMCAGFPNVLEAELVDVGSPGIAYGYLADPGRITVSMTPAHAMQAPHIVRLPGVSVFIAALSQSACAYQSVTLDASAYVGDAMHHLTFGTCQPGHDVAITGSNGDWSFTGGGLASAFGCSPHATSLSSGRLSAALTAGEVKVAGGTIGGQPWSLWSQKGSRGVDGIKSGGLVLSGRWYGMCPMIPLNPAQFDLIDAGPRGVVYGFVASPGDYAIRLSGQTLRERLPAPSAMLVQGGTFFIGLLPRSACDYSSMTLDATGKSLTDTHNLSFGSCKSRQLVTVNGGSGSW
jgi:hypothetical protein